MSRLSNEDILTLAAKDAVVAVHGFRIQDWDVDLWTAALRGEQHIIDNLSLDEAGEIIQLYRRST